MAASTQRQAAGPNPTSSQTQLALPGTQTQTQPAAILRLRGGHNPTGRSVQWSEDVVDNEGLGRKTSKGKSSRVSGMRQFDDLMWVWGWKANSL